MIRPKASHSFLIVRVLADRGLELLSALGHADDLLLDGDLLGLEVANLLLESGRFSAHLSVVARDVLVNAVQLILEGLAGVLALHGEHVLEGLLLRAQNLNLLLVSVELLVQGARLLHQRVELALQVRSVVGLTLCVGSSLHVVA